MCGAEQKPLNALIPHTCQGAPGEDPLSYTPDARPQPLREEKVPFLVFPIHKSSDSSIPGTEEKVTQHVGGVKSHGQGTVLLRGVLLVSISHLTQGYGQT